MCLLIRNTHVWQNHTVVKSRNLASFYQKDDKFVFNIVNRFLKNQFETYFKPIKICTCLFEVQRREREEGKARTGTTQVRHLGFTDTVLFYSAFKPNVSKAHSGAVCSQCGILCT